MRLPALPETDTMVRRSGAAKSFQLLTQADTPVIPMTFLKERHIGGTVADHAVFSDIQSFFNSHIFTSVILMGSASVAALFRSVLPDNIHPSE